MVHTEDETIEININLCEIELRYATHYMIIVKEFVITTFIHPVREKFNQ